MTKIKSLQDKYDEITRMEEVDQIAPTFDFVKTLLHDNSDEVVSFHFSLLKMKELPKLYRRIRKAFTDRPHDIITPFLLSILKNETNIEDQADAIQMLGKIRCNKVLPIARDRINSTIRDIRYRCIIVIGWLGNEKDLRILNERLENENDDQLRGYSATAMRQIWLKKRAKSEDILPLLYKSIKKEESEETLSLIIIVIQDILNKKFGLQEVLSEGVIKGNTLKAKEKVFKYLKNNNL